MAFNFKSIPWKWIAAAAVLFFVVKGCFFSGGKEGELEVIRTAKAVKGDLVQTVDAMGEVKPYNRVEIKAPIAGRVEEVLIKEGDSVKQGQILAWMSSTERAALLDAARSQGDEAYKKWQEAYKAAPLVAPLDGKIIARSVEPGQTVTTVDPIVVISDRLIVKALVDETDLAQIETGQKTEIRLDAYRNKKINGTVDHISHESQLINNVNVYDIDILPEELPPAFRSGMTANVTFIVADRRDVLLVPSEAVAEWPRKVKKPEGAEFAVYKKGLGKLEPKPVQIGESDGKMTEILSGLSEGESIVIVRKKQGAAKGAAFSPMRPRSGSTSSRPRS